METPQDHREGIAIGLVPGENIRRVLTGVRDLCRGVIEEIPWIGKPISAAIRRII